MLFSFLLPVSGLLIQDISSPAAGIAFLWFSYDHGVILGCSYIAPIAPSMDICVLCITQSTSSLFYRLLFVIYHLHLSVAYFYPAARDKIFFRKKTNFRQQAWSLPILFLCLSFMTDVFSFTVISLRFHLLFIYIVRNWYIRLFSLLTSTYCLLLCTGCCRKPVFFWILSLIPAAALAPLICMHFSFVIFALISYRWYFIFITPKFFLFSCICIIYNWYLFLFHRNFAYSLFYLYHLWLAYLLLLLILLHRLLLCTDCCRKSVFFWILSLIPAAALALLYLHALFFYHLCLMCLFIPYTISNHLYMMFFLCTCGFPYGSYCQKCYFHHL